MVCSRSAVAHQARAVDQRALDAAKQKAIDKAYARARTYADTLAKASGKQLGVLLSGSVDTQQAIPVVPYARMAMTTMEAKAPAPTEDFQASKIKVTAHVNALFGMQ